MAKIDDNEKIIENAVKRLDLKIATLISRLGVKSGRLTSDAASLRKAINTRRDIAKEFGKYNVSVRTATDFSPVLKEIDLIFKEAGISKAIGPSDESIVRIMSSDSTAQMAGLSDQYAAQVSSKVYTSVLAGDEIDDLTLGVRQLLIGGTDKAGRPMVNHAKTISTTGYREVDSTIMKQKAEEFEIIEFKYSGSLIKDSRKWCQDHVGKIYTLEEIQNWESKSWKGKKSGDPFVTRGGWNCRHRWIPVVD